MKITVTPNCPKLNVGWYEQANGGGRCYIYFMEDHRYDWCAALLSKSHNTVEFDIYRDDGTEEEVVRRVTLEATEPHEEKILSQLSWYFREKECEHFLFYTYQDKRDTMVRHEHR